VIQPPILIISDRFCSEIALLRNPDLAAPHLFSLEPRIRDAAAALLRMLGTPDALAALEQSGREDLSS
jgi:hypothetical protein